MLEPGSGISFQLTGGQGAALLTKHPTYREDARLERNFEEYTKENYDYWVAFARERGHPNIELILVTGVDMTRDFSMISYSNDGDELMTEFKISAPGVAPLGDMAQTGSGLHKLWPPATSPSLRHTNRGLGILWQQSYRGSFG